MKSWRRYFGERRNSVFCHISDKRMDSVWPRMTEEALQFPREGL